MRRACKVTLKYATAKKRRQIGTLVLAYRAAVNFYIRSLWQHRGKLDKNTLARLADDSTRLTARYKSQALKQALETVVATRKSAKARKKRAKCPVFKGALVLDSKFVTIGLDPSADFDLHVTLSTVVRRRRITIPTKRTRVLNKWLSRPGATLICGAAVTEHGLILWVDVPPSDTNTNKTIGVDIGVNKLLVTSDNVQLGCDFKAVRDRVASAKPKSQRKQRAIRFRDQYVRRTVNQLPWGTFNVIAVENLKNLKKGKTGKRGKAFRKAMAPWTYCQVIEAIRQKAEEYGVHLMLVPPAYTSQTCPVCGKVSTSNRKAEAFCCIDCGYTSDADYVGAQNVLNKALRLAGSLESPALTN